MQIQKMFEDDINRKINGVIKVDQLDDTTEREVEEYVITREVKRHFMTFFDYYGDSFNEPTDDIGVWISGFFGSGKSHFLKMLSYILENRTINGISTVERFRKKFEGDEGTFMSIHNATRGETRTILFNIDVEGSINKDKTAVLRVFAKMFYNYLGFYGENLKVAKLEQFIAKRGKTEEFHRVFEEKNGASWLETRDAFAFFEDDVVETLMEVLCMSETAARNWFNGTETTEMSIAQLVSEMKEYVDEKPSNFRLLFMIDEVGQYIGEDTNLLINLQSLVEEIGRVCKGKIWVVCTGQEAIDEVIKTRQDEFSRIQARFKTRLSLTSSSVDEVIQKRILKKKPEAVALLNDIYDQNDSVLRNLFSFTDSVLDIKGFTGAKEFEDDFPFVPYQFIIMQKVLNEIRKYGNSGKHMSSGERSMLECFQVAAKNVQERNELTLVPFYMFYDPIHRALDSSIRRVIDRCQRAADNHYGIEEQDVNLLKLLYLVRYVDDIKTNLDNLVIMMADDINADKITMRGKVQASLDRLMSQNYIARAGDVYNFLTDEEQDIAREIKNTSVDTASIVERIARMIFGDIYPAKKYRYGKYDFPFDTMVDSTMIGSATGGMRLRFMTIAADAVEKSELRLMTESKDSAIIVLAENTYYEALESAMKIRKYVKQRNVNQLAKSVQDIICDQQDEATKYENSVIDSLSDAIVKGVVYVDGEKIDIRPGSVSVKETEDPAKRDSEIKKAKAVSVIDQALEYLVSHVYSELNLITKNVISDTEIVYILKGTEAQIPGTEDNRDAAAKMEEFLEIQYQKKLPTSMADIQSRYQAIPYGWKEIDVAAVTALLIYQQKVTIKYGGATIHSDDPKLPDMLRKKSEIGKTSISKKISPSAQSMRMARELLREYFDVMDVPDDEEGLVKFIIENFSDRKAHYEKLQERYRDYDGQINRSKYPDYMKLEQGIELCASILSQKKDNIALVERVVKLEASLLDNKEDLQNLESFFLNQVAVFDAAVKMERDLRNELSYLQQEEESNKALNSIRRITLVNGGNTDVYRKIPELNQLMAKVREGHDRLLAAKREELLEIVRQCMEKIHTSATDDARCKGIIAKADKYFTQKKQEISELKSLALLDGLVPQMWSYKDDTVDQLEVAAKPPVVTPPKPPTGGGKPAQPKKRIKNVYRQAAFPVKTLENKEDVDAYVERMRAYLNAMLQDCDGIKLS